MTGIGSIAGVSLGNSVMLQWDANTESDLAGYQLYYSCNRVYPPFNGIYAWQGVSPVDVGNRTSYTLTGLNADCEYWSAALTAYNTGDIESDYSNIVTWEFANEKTRHISIGSATGTGMIASLSDGLGAVSGTGDILLPYAYPEGVGAAAGINTELTVAAGSVIYNGLGATSGLGTLEATGVIYTIFGNGAATGVGNLRTLNAVYMPLKVVKHGIGSVYVSGPGIDCGSDCETTIPYGQSLTLRWEKDSTLTDVFSWGNACQYAERRTTCTISADSAGQLMHMESSGYAIASIVTGSFANPICRTGFGTSTVTLWPSLQAAYTAITQGIANNPIDCIELAGDGTFKMESPTDVTLVGGWIDFVPGRLGGVTNITGGLIIKFGSLTIGGTDGGAVVIK